MFAILLRSFVSWELISWLYLMRKVWKAYVTLGYVMLCSTLFKRWSVNRTKIETARGLFLNYILAGNVFITCSHIRVEKVLWIFKMVIIANKLKLRYFIKDKFAYTTYYYSTNAEKFLHHFFSRQTCVNLII
jgi:hypothetical protein